MFAKFVFFASLLVCSFSILVSVKCSEVSDPSLALDSDSDSDSEFFTLPINFERYNIIQESLDELGASADNFSMEIMTELTFGYEEITIRNLVIDMVKESKTDPIDRAICIEKLEKAIRKYDKNQRSASKLNQLAKIISKNFILAPDGDKLKIVDQQTTVTPKSQLTQYPLLDDVFHPDKMLFIETVEQLKLGKFSEEFSRGILLYGPPGVGKNEIVEAMVHESGCHIFGATASELVSRYQGSGSEAIKSIFAQARAVEPGRGVIVLIDELQSVTPVISDKNAPVAHTYSGQDYDNTLTQLWIEYDRCLKEGHDNIMIIATCNEFDRIDERIRGRFDCVEFSYPDKLGTIEILKNKSKHYDVPLSKSELKKYAVAMEGLSGRDLTKFIKNVKRYTRNGKKKEEALELSARHQVKVTEDAKPTEAPNNRFEQLKNEALRGTAYGAGTALGGTLVAGAVTVFLFGIKKILGGSQKQNVGSVQQS